MTHLKNSSISKGVNKKSVNVIYCSSELVYCILVKICQQVVNLIFVDEICCRCSSNRLIGRCNRLAISCPHKLQVILWNEPEVAWICVLEHTDPVLNLVETANDVALPGCKMSRLNCCEVVRDRVNFEVFHFSKSLKEFFVQDD